jgi:phosphoglucosamine mutase
MPRLFGTDGVRGVANQDLTPDLVLALGRAAAQILAPDGGAVVVGRDTRLSGPMLEAALVAGLTSGGATALVAEVIPTAAVAYLTLREKAQAGAVISASHNPVADNGIKFFSDAGMKIAPSVEERIEQLIESPPENLSIGNEVAAVESLEHAVDEYVDHLTSTLRKSLSGVRLVLDCAHGAAHRAAPQAFREAGAEVAVIHSEPDGTRINVDCGSTNMAELAKTVVAEGADLGLAFDGDADRVLAVDERGEEVDGDRILGLAALNLHALGELKNNLVVVTVMTNLGLTSALQAKGIEVFATPVGDRNVADAIADRGASLGGEQSGHIIFAEHTTTGDGILTGLQLAQILSEANEPASRVLNFFEPFPQVLLNVRVSSKDGLQDAAEVWDALKEAETSLGDDGRVLLRPSGTESVVRVMVEAKDQHVAETTADRLAEIVRTSLT